MAVTVRIMSLAILPAAIAKTGFVFNVFVCVCLCLSTNQKVVLETLFCSMDRHISGCEYIGRCV